MKKYLWNFPEERRIFGVTEFPTRVSIPNWDVIRRPPSIKAGPLSIPPPPRPAMVANLSVKVIGDYNEKGLCSAPSDPKAPVTLSYSSIKEHVERKTPIEDPAVVEWMQFSETDDLICEMTEEEYKRAGSNLVSASGDPYIPGCKLDDIRFKSEKGSTVAGRGNAVLVTPHGNIDVPVPGKATGIFEDLLCFGAVTNAWPRQWSGVLLKWESLTKNPDSRIRFPSFSGLVAPQFIGHEAGVAFPTNYVVMHISTDKPQTMKVKYRETSDYTQEITSLDVDLKKGKNEVSYTLLILPYVPTMAVELIPEDETSTILDDYSVSVP